MKNGVRIIIKNIQFTEFEEIKRESIQMPWWYKQTFSVQEAAEYWGFSDKKIRKLIDEDENADYILWNGSRPRIKRVLFEKFVNEKLSAI